MTFQGVRPPEKLIWEIIVTLMCTHVRTLQFRIKLDGPLMHILETLLALNS